MTLQIPNIASVQAAPAAHATPFSVIAGRSTNEKAPGAINTEGLTTDTNDLNFATGKRRSKTIATQVAELVIRGHAVHQLKDGGFLVCKYGHTFHAHDFAELQAFARRLGVSQ